MGNEVTLRVKLSEADLKRAQAEIDKLDDKTLSVGTRGRDSNGRFSERDTGIPSPSETQKSSSAMSELNNKLGKVGLALGGMAVAGMAADRVWTSFLDKDEQLAELSKATDLAGRDLDRLNVIATRLSDKFGTSVVSNIDAFKIAISKLGPEIAEDDAAFEQIGENINTFAKAAKIEAADSAAILSNALLGLGYSTADASTKAAASTRIMNVLSAASQVGAIEADAVAESMLKAGSQAKLAGLSIEETAAQIEVIGELYSNGAENGTQFVGVLSAMGKGRFIPQGTREELEKLGIDVNKVSDATIPWSDRLRMLEPLLKDSALAGAFFGDSAKNAGLYAIQNVDKFQKFSGAVTGTKTATDQAAIGADTYRDKWSKITNYLTNTGVRALELARNRIVDIVDDTTNLVNMLFDLAKLDFDSVGKRLGNTAAQKKHATEEAEIARAKAAKNKATAEGAKATATETEEAKKQITTLGTLRTELSAAEAALENWDVQDKAGYARQQRRVESLRKRIEQLTGTGRAAAAFVAGSLGAMEAAADKLREKMRNLPANSQAYIDAKKTSDALKSDIDLITSGAAEHWGNNLVQMKADIAARAEEIQVGGVFKLGDVMKRLREEPIELVEVDSERFEQSMEEVKQEMEDSAKSAVEFGNSIGTALADAYANNLPILKEFLKSILVATLDFLEKYAALKIGEAAISDLGTLGPAGLIKSAITSGLIFAALKTARAAIVGMATGGVLVGERGPEVIAPAKEFSEFAGSIVQNAIEYMRSALRELSVARSQQVAVTTRLEGASVQFELRGNDLYAAVQLAEQDRLNSVFGRR